MQNTHYSCQVLMKIKFFDRLSKYNQILNVMKIRPVGAEYFHADGKTDGRTDG
jgi:hypothetical protein